VSATKTSKTVLVVEDNSIQREGLASVLRNEGYRVLAAADGEEALKYLRGDPTPDLLLLDMMNSPCTIHSLDACNILS